MSEEPPISNNDNEDDRILPETPNDISRLVEDIQDREAQRRKAVEINLENAKAASSEDERDYWLVKAMEFGDILDEYKSQYPELFPSGDPEDDSRSSS